MKFSVNSPCPCGSGNKYKKCCQPFHKGGYPKTAKELMASRYTAFALKDYKYIIKTTHKDNQDYTTNTESWKNSILAFCETSEFVSLKIVEFTDGKNEAYVTFIATIISDGKDISFTEKSKFYKLENLWLYHSGEFLYT